jgi:hypothetical protein
VVSKQYFLHIFFHGNPACIYLLPQAYHTTSLCHPFWYDHSLNIWQRSTHHEVAHYSIFLRTPLTFCPLAANFLSRILVSKNPSLCFLTYVRGNVILTHRVLQLVVLRCWNTLSVSRNIKTIDRMINITSLNASWCWH